MKICVYLISKNEVQQVDRCLQSIKDADLVAVADTGSTDGTVEKLKAAGVLVQQVNVSPWRFDVARNLSLDLVPDDFDVCICLDMDEVMLPGWRKALEECWQPNTTRLRYQYIWSHLPDGKPDVTYWGDKIHIRHGYLWRHPVHECLYRQEINEVQTWSNLKIEHFPDHKKSRGSYLPLLELSVREDPDNDRNAYYLGREYFFYRRFAECKRELMRHLALPSAGWKAERAASMRYLSKTCAVLDDKDEALAWLVRATAEAPGEREPWLELAQVYYERRNFLGGYFAAMQALAIKERPPTYITNGSSWGERPYDLAGTCAYYVGLLEESRKHSIEAWRQNPNDPRLVGNVKLVRRGVRNSLPENEPVIHMLWPTVRPTVMLEALKLWKSRAKRDFRLRVAVNTAEQRDQLIEIPNVMVVGDERPGATYATYMLGKDLEGLPGDIVILASDDFVPPENWDEWVISQFKNFDGCLVVNDGHHSDRNIVTIPIMDYSCLKRLNGIIYHPAYHHLYSDEELFHNVKEMNLLRDLRNSEPVFEHKHWINQKRVKDKVDELVYTHNTQDYEIFKSRMKLSLKERLAI